MKLPRWLSKENVIVGSIAGLGAWLALRRFSPSGPASSFNQPAEDFSPLEDEKGCSPAPKPGVVAFRSFVLNNFKGSDLGITRECVDGAISGHQLGRAWDWGVAGGAQTSEFFRWVFANNAEMVRRTGITYMIFQRQIWNTRSRVWQAYTGANPHTDHVHISFGTPGAMGQTSFYTSRQS